MEADEQCRCAFCRSDLPFSIPNHLVDELLNGNVVVFAGGGISTENHDHAHDTFYKRIAAELKADEGSSFPELMSKYCSQPNGRIRLIQSIKDRFDYFIAFGDFYNQMTKFHRAISPMFMIKDVVTTNWDDFFERECALDAFVNESDMPLWSASKRRLLKIHGSIRNLGSIVATTEDYRASERRLNNGVMGAQLKALLAQKTFIYTGYSLSDSTFLKLAKRLAKMIYPNLRHSYFVSPQIDMNKLSKFPIPLTPIQTDGAYFFEQLRVHVGKKAGILPDHAFESCEELLDRVVDEHIDAADAFTSRPHPLLIFALSYQDGLIHGLGRISRQKNTGEYHCRSHVAQRAQAYEMRAKEFRRKKDYWNACYAEGYCDALAHLLISSERRIYKWPPLYGTHCGIDFGTLSSITRFPKKKIDPRRIAQARRILAKVTSSGEVLIPDHTPYL
ncbi:SIR2 family protein [Methylocystis hirsuta]|uniref:Uncharacterized protein n=1 Tax=Methylocystis hirsuta TaxID=369798 RepID=A0A3M9XML4_9HYPH|nr:SIR2 family protein [Methylocystis hirsuta]RNJ49517.1 hypothetical protein D1O30_07765 [Methylocystis hirsuta]